MREGVDMGADATSARPVPWTAVPSFPLRALAPVDISENASLRRVWRPEQAAPSDVGLRRGSARKTVRNRALTKGSRDG
jgi:hypothetical protein